MTKFRLCVAAAASVAALTFATSSRAADDDNDNDNGTKDDDQAQVAPAQPAPAQPPVVTTQPAQPAPAEQNPQIYVVTPPAAPQTSTTQTTGANYASNDAYAEREVSIRPNRPLLSTGAGIFLISYGASAVTGAISDNDSDQKLYIPVAGPWMDLADRPSCNGNCSTTENTNRALLVTSGIVQGAGVLLALSSLFIPEHIEEKRVAKNKPEVHVLPVSFNAGAGVGAIGRF